MISSTGRALCIAFQAPIYQQTRACMKTGFLILETHPEHSGLVRVRRGDKVPELTSQRDGTVIRYIARFQDVEAGQMHVQNVMHNRLMDLENRIYRSDLCEMIACIEADGLDHARVWMDPTITKPESERIESMVLLRRHRQKVVDLIWQTVGIIGLLLLLITGLNP